MMFCEQSESKREPKTSTNQIFLYKLTEKGHFVNVIYNKNLRSVLSSVFWIMLTLY